MRSRVLMAFTLIELLVVVTIIATLLALLMPALDSAMYQAQLVTCSAQIDGMVNGVTHYAMDHKRSYPYKRPIHTHESYWATDGLRTLPSSDRTAERTATMQRYDYRLVIADYYKAALFVDPLSALKVDMDPAVTHNDATIHAAYILMDGILYTGAPRSEDGRIDYGSKVVGEGMMKMGSRIRWAGPGGGEFTFNVLVGDRLQTGFGATNMSTSHHDREGKATQNYRDGKQGPFMVGGKNQYMWIRWEGYTTDRPTHDLNFGHQDGSVRRVGGIGPPPVNAPFNSGDYPLLPTPTIIESNPSNHPGGWLNGWQTWLPSGG